MQMFICLLNCLLYESFVIVGSLKAGRDPSFMQHTARVLHVCTESMLQLLD